jgi:hypothetical protein
MPLSFTGDRNDASAYSRRVAFISAARSDHRPRYDEAPKWAREILNKVMTVSFEDHDRLRFRQKLSVAFAAVILLGGVCVQSAAAQATTARPSPRPTPKAASSEQDELISFLDRVLDWYRMSKLPPQAPLDPALTLLLSSAPETTLAVVKAAFEYARADATLLQKAAITADLKSDEQSALTPNNQARAKNSSSTGDRLAQRKAQLQAEVEQLTSDIERLKLQAATAPEAQKSALLAKLAAEQNQLRLDRVGLEFFAEVENFEQSGSPISGTSLGLQEKIDEMAASVPELSLQHEPLPAADIAKAGASVQYPPAGTGIWGRASLLFAFQKEQERVARLSQATARLAQEFDALPKAMRLKARNLVQQMHQLAARDVADTDPLVVEQRSREFDSLLAELRSMGKVLAPAEAGRSLLRTYQATLNEYQTRLKREAYRAMQDLLQQALLLSIVFGFIFGGAVVWRRLALRYVLDPRRFHQLMVFRTMTVVLVSVMVLIFKFATDLAALATVMGFAAAGIAFALQNVILSVVGYFSIIGRNGIRVGDRVGLQGPFGYVYGEILELGILRISLRELTSGPDNWTPSGRTVVFPNSVVFTGSFLKLPRSAPSTHKTT